VFDAELRREITYWQELLTKVAQDLERAASVEKDPKTKAWFSGRAMRIRKRLHDGMPEDYVPDTGAQRMNPQG
jgi:hypothetical protein